LSKLLINVKITLANIKSEEVKKVTLPRLTPCLLLANDDINKVNDHIRQVI
jgi:hypothetical protein